MSGSLSIPNTFATASGNVPATQLDTNNTTIRDYINNREITVGLLASRPAAGISGRYYFATDSGLGYVDTGSSWLQISNTGVGVSIGRPSVQGLVATNNSGTPTTKYDLAAQFVTLRNPSDGTLVVQASTGTITNDTGAASAANGRDQAGAFSASTDLHFYFIWDGATLATLSSVTAPPTGPTLPGAYTHWAYACTVRYDTTPRLAATHVQGSYVSYDTCVFIAINNASTGFTTCNYSSVVSAICRPRLYWACHAASGVVSYALQTVQAQNLMVLNINTATAYSVAMPVDVPNLSQAVNFHATTTSGTPTQDLGIMGYFCPNGDA